MDASKALLKIATVPMKKNAAIFASISIQITGAIATHAKMAISRSTAHHKMDAFKQTKKDVLEISVNATVNASFLAKRIGALAKRAKMDMSLSMAIPKKDATTPTTKNTAKMSQERSGALMNVSF